MSEYGQTITDKRIRLGYSLRAFCVKFNYDCGNFSKMERGILRPFTGDKLEKLCKELDMDFFEKIYISELAEKEVWPDSAKEQIQKLVGENEKLKEEIKELKEGYDANDIHGTSY